MIKFNTGLAGMRYYEDSFIRLRKPNPDAALTPEEIISSGRVGEQIPFYTYPKSPVTVKPEEMGGQFIMKVYLKDLPIGWVATPEDARTLEQILKVYKIKYISAYIHGGGFKWTSDSGNVNEAPGAYKIYLSVGYVKE